MAKRKAKTEAVTTAASTPPAAPEAPKGPTVLVFAGHDEAGGVLTGVASPDPDPLQPFQERSQEIHIGGSPYVHVYDAADGAWIYAPRNAAHR